MSKGIIVTCGTNGKQRQTILWRRHLRQRDIRLFAISSVRICLAALQPPFYREMSIFGKLKADYACLEIDEAYTPIVFDYVKPNVMVITNLFRDQLDRNGEIDITSDIIKRAIKKCRI